MAITVKEVETRIKDQQGNVYTYKTLAADYEKTAPTTNNSNDSTPELDDPGN